MKEDRKCRKCSEKLQEDESTVLTSAGVYHVKCYAQMSNWAGDEDEKRIEGTVDK